MSKIHGAFICARYSTDNQNPDSIEVQVSKCKEWCQKNNLPVLGIYADEAVSGMKDSRPQYDQMMEHLRLGMADTVIIYDQSRMFRKMTAWFSFRDQLSAMGVSIVSVTQPSIGKDLRDPMNFMTEGSMALFNQIWALQSRQKTMEKMRFMARNGQHTGGVPALGYKVEDGRLTICEDEAAVVRRIFNEYVSGLSYKEIIAGLNRDGIKTKRGNKFGTNSLHDLLKNEKYIGVLIYGGRPYREDGSRNTHAPCGSDAIRIENAIPAIIDPETFQKVQERLKQNKRQQGGRPPVRRDYLLKGKVFCGECKSAMGVSISFGKYFYYHCSSKKRTGDCNNKPISVDDLEDLVAQAVQNMLVNPKNSKKLLSILKQQAGTIQNSAVSALQSYVAEWNEIQGKLNNATDAVLSGLNSPTLTAKVAELEARKTELDFAMRKLKASVDASAIPEARLTEIIEMLISTKGVDKAALLSIVYRVEVYNDRIDIWTLLDADPNGDFYTKDGLIITPGIASGVPKHSNPNLLPIGETFGFVVFLNDLN